MDYRPSNVLLPEQPAAAIRSRQRERYFGSKRDWDAAILTPIAAIYNALPSGRSLTGGWWQSKEWKDVLICATPQASAILDPLCALEPTTPVLFLGLAGALSDFAIGDIVEPSSALLDGLEYAPSWEPSYLYPDANVVTLPSLNSSLPPTTNHSSDAHLQVLKFAMTCSIMYRILFS